MVVCVVMMAYGDGDGDGGGNGGGGVVEWCVWCVCVSDGHTQAIVVWSEGEAMVVWCVGITYTRTTHHTTTTTYTSITIPHTSNRGRREAMVVVVVW